MAEMIAPMTIRGTTLRFGTRTYVMGIINVTPDSFSGDGLVGDDRAPVDDAVALAQQMAADGADLLDVGGESTRPGHDAVNVDAELARVEGVIAAIRAVLPNMPISVDTRKSDVAEAAISAGADMINDVAGVTGAAGLAPVAAAHRAPYLLMHSRQQPEYQNVAYEVRSDLRSALQLAQDAGCDADSLLVDPGIGFGKTAEQNLAMLRDLDVLTELGRPILLGTSRKSTIGRVLDLPPDQRLEGTLATTALGIAAGVDIIRVHDVAANVRVARMSDAIVRGRWPDADGAGL